MNMTEVEKSLKEIFNKPLKDEEIRKNVFWTDYDEEFKDDYQKNYDEKSHHMADMQIEIDLDDGV